MSEQQNCTKAYNHCIAFIYSNCVSFVSNNIVLRSINGRARPVMDSVIVPPLWRHSTIGRRHTSFLSSVHASHAARIAQGGGLGSRAATERPKTPISSPKSCTLLCCSETTFSLYCSHKGIAALLCSCPKNIACCPSKCITAWLCNLEKLHRLCQVKPCANAC